MDPRELKDKATQLFSKGKFAKAAEAYEEYCKADPKDLQARLRLGDAWIKAAKKDKAVAAYTWAAEGFAREGFLPRAIAASKLVLELEPASKGVQKMLADLYAMKSSAPSRVLKPPPLGLEGDEPKSAAPGFAQREDAIDLDAPVAKRPSARSQLEAPSPTTRSDAIDLPPDELTLEPVRTTIGGVANLKGPSPMNRADAIEIEDEAPPPPAPPQPVEIEIPIELVPPPAPPPAAPPPPPAPPPMALDPAPDSDAQLSPILAALPTLGTPTPLPPIIPGEAIASTPRPRAASALPPPAPLPISFELDVPAPSAPVFELEVIEPEPEPPAPLPPPPAAVMEAAPSPPDTIVLPSRALSPPPPPPPVDAAPPPGLRPKGPGAPAFQSSTSRIRLPTGFTPPAPPLAAPPPAATAAPFTELELEGESLLHAVEAAAAQTTGAPPFASMPSQPVIIEEAMDPLDEPKPNALPRIPLFSDLPPDAFIALFEQCPLRRFDEGAIIIEQGTRGESFFVICAGRVKVLRTDKGERREVATLEEGAFFGEMALLSDAPRSASVVAGGEDTQVLEISAALLAELSGKYPTVASALKKFCRQRLLSNLLASAPLFRPFSRSDRRELIQKFRARDVRSGDLVIREGGTCDGLYVVLSGEVEVRIKGATVAALREGEIFGEMSLLTKAPAAASVVSTKHTSLLRLPREDFDLLISSYPQILEHVAELTDARRKRNALV